MDVLLTTLRAASTNAGAVDTRGQVVCGIPPKEAVAIVYESSRKPRSTATAA